MKPRYIVPLLLSSSIFVAASASAQLTGPTRGEGGYFRFGLGGAVAQDFARDVMPFPAALGVFGIGGFIDEAMALELNIDMTFGANPEGPSEVAIIGSGVHGALRYFVDDSLPELYAFGGAGLAVDGSELDSTDGLGAGLVLGAGWEAFQNGFGAMAFYTPRVPALATEPRFVHAICVAAYVALGL